MKKIIALVIAVAVVCGLTSMAHPFTDVKGHWAEAQLEKAYNNGMINGDPDGRFRPDDNISRAEFMKMLTAATSAWLEIPESEIDRFADSTHWAMKYYNFSLYQGWIINYSYGSDPEFEEFAEAVRVGEILPGNMDTSNFNTPIERWEMAYLASRYAHSICGSSMAKKAKNDYADYVEVSRAYPGIVLNHISCSFGAGIMTGDTDGKLNTTDNGTRAQAAVMVNRYLDLIDSEYKMLPDTNKTYTEIPQGHPVVVITFVDERTVEMELYPEYAPQTVAHFVDLVESGFYNEEFDVNGVSKENFPTVGSLCTFSSPKAVEYTIYGEFAKNGYEKNALPFVKGTAVLDYMWSYNDGGANFRILAEDMPQKEGNGAAFGKVIKGMDVLDSLIAEGDFTMITSIVIK